jgi:hypothetical protein
MLKEGLWGAQEAAMRAMRAVEPGPPLLLAAALQARAPPSPGFICRRYLLILYNFLFICYFFKKTTFYFLFYASILFNSILFFVFNFVLLWASSTHSRPWQVRRR